MDELERLINERELARKNRGYKSKEYLYLKRKVVYLRTKLGVPVKKITDISKVREKLLPLFSVLMKKEREKMLRDEEKELKRAIRPYVVEAVINDTYEMDMEALIDITRDKINAEKVSG